MSRQWPQYLVVFGVVLAIIGSAGSSPASHLDESPRRHRIVYQLDEPGADRARFVLGNIRNHIAGVGGTQNIEALELVVFGPALKTFVTDGMDPGVRQALEGLQAQGLTFGACGNTMKSFAITLEQLPRGAQALPQGGVVRLMELQERGYAYIRP
jgi:intracellular sulfur oxidation DsrE/DsrF family protein